MPITVPALPTTSLRDGIIGFQGLSSDPRREDYTNPDGVYTVLQGSSTKRIKCFFQDSQDPGVPYDPESLSAVIYDRLGEEVRTITYNPGAIHREKEGSYYYDFTTPLGTANDFAFSWSYENSSSSGGASGMSYLHVIPLTTYRLFPQLRNWVNKSSKMVGLTGVGYTDSNLFIYLTHAVQEINSVQPITNLRLTDFPIAQFGSLLVESAVIIALYSQGGFAIDTDIPTYSDQGTSLNLDHWNRIQAYITSLATKLSPQLKLMKMDYMSTGSILFQSGPNLPFRWLISAAPSGLFRNLFTAGGALTQNIF